MVKPTETVTLPTVAEAQTALTVATKTEAVAVAQHVAAARALKAATDALDAARVASDSAQSILRKSQRAAADAAARGEA